MNFEGIHAKGGERELLQDVINNFPSTFQAIEPNAPGIFFSSEEIELKKLSSKVKTTIHGRLGNTISTGTESATKEEMNRFLELLEDEAQKYLSLVDNIKKSGFIR